LTQHLALPPARSLEGAVRVPPSKSATNRALLLAALTAEPVEVVRPLESGDTDALVRCLAAMGADIRRTGDGLRVSGPLRGNPGTEVSLDAGDSGTAARFLIAAAAVTPGRFVLGGSPRLCERPMGELVHALRGAGARLTHRGREGCLPLAIEGGGLVASEIPIDASRSSQFV
jgi:3-phosphoshikimate 1-carboxyvinyltransferase